MVNIYLRYLKAGSITLEQIPARWRDEVKARYEAEKNGEN